METPTRPEGERDRSYIVVGRVRRPHGIRGELVVEPFTDVPGAVFAPGRRVFAGSEAGDLAADGGELHVLRSSSFKGGLIVAVRELRDRNDAEGWRDRYLLAPADELPPPRDDELYVRDLVGMRAQLPSGTDVGIVKTVYELPQGLVLEIERPQGDVLVPFHESAVARVDVSARVIHLDPPAGLLD